MEQPFYNALCFTNTADDLIQCAAEGKVDQNGTKSHGKQERWLIFFFDGEINQKQADQVHDKLLPGDG